MKNILFFCLSLTGLLSASASAALISPTSLNPGTMGYFSSLHLPEYAVDGSGMDGGLPLTPDSAVLATTQDTGNTWLAGSAPSENGDSTIYFNFDFGNDDSGITLSSFYLWNYHDPDNANQAHHTGIGVNEFSLTFYDDLDGEGAALSSTGRLFASAATPNADVTAQIFSFDAVDDVFSVGMTIFSNHGSNFPPGFHEVAFSGESDGSVPVPPTLLLILTSLVLLAASSKKNTF